MDLIRKALFFLLTCSAVAVTTASIADAGEPTTSVRTASLTYVVAAGKECPDETSFRDRVVARVGVDPFVAQSSTAIVVRIQPRVNKLVGVVELRAAASAPRTREISTAAREGCESLVSALAATVALTLDPQGEAARSARASAPPAPATPSSTVTPPAKEEDAPAPSSDAPHPTPPSPAIAKSSPPLVPLVAVGGAGGIALTPSPSVGAELGIGLRRGAWALLVHGRFDTMPSAVTVAKTDAVELTLLGGGVLPCGLLGNFRLCGVVRGGFAQGRTTATDRPAPEGSAFALVGLRPGLVLPLIGGVALSAEVEAGAMVARTQLVVDGKAIWTAPPTYATAILGGIFFFGDGS